MNPKPTTPLHSALLAAGARAFPAAARAVRRLGTRARTAPEPAGFSVLELLIVVTVIGLLSSIAIPHQLCSMEKARVASFLVGIVKARDAVESFQIEHGHYPAGLEEVFSGQAPPPWLSYCSAETEDPNNGHGNDCDLSDGQNPSGKPGPHAIELLDYRLWTRKSLAPGCQQIDYLQMTGGFGPPQIVRLGEKIPRSSKPAEKNG